MNNYLSPQQFGESMKKRKMTLTGLTIQNFKGENDIKITFKNDKMKIISGDNGVGKTRIADAYNWALSHENSTGDPGTGVKAFAVRPLDENNKLITGLKTLVCVEFNIDGKDHKVIKSIEDKTSKKIGGKITEKTKYKINDLPLKTKGAYDSKLKEILGVKMDVFKILSDVYQFNKEDDKKKRDLLMTLGDSKTEDELIKLHPDCDKIVEVIGTHNIEDSMTIQKEQRRLLNDDLNEIVIRIDQEKKSIVEIDDTSEVESKIEVLESEETEINEKINSINEDRKKKDQLYKNISTKKAELDTSQKEDKNVGEKPLNDAKKVYTDSSTELSNKKAEIDTQNRLKSNLQEDIKQISKDNIVNENKKAQLKTDFANKKAEVFNYTKVFEYPDFTPSENKFEVCECCGKDPYPTKRKKVAEAELKQYNDNKAVALKKFDDDKSNALERFNTSIRIAINEMQKEASTLKENSVKFEQNHTNKTSEISLIDEKIDKLNKEVVKLEKTVAENKIKVDNVVLNGIESQKTIDLKKDVDNAEKMYNEFAIQDTIDLNNRLSEIRKEIEELKNSIQSKIENDKSLGRIKALEEEQKQKGIKVAVIEQNIELLSEFIKYKVRSIEDSIKSMFKIATFKLYEIQSSNGLTRELCETLVNGIPYTTSVNTAAKINVGIDIINTLSDHYGFSCPLWVDSAESVNVVEESENQMILLKVTKDDFKDFDSIEEFEKDNKR